MENRHPAAPPTTTIAIEAIDDPAVRMHILHLYHRSVQDQLLLRRLAAQMDAIERRQQQMLLLPQQQSEWQERQRAQQKVTCAPASRTTLAQRDFSENSSTSHNPAGSAESHDRDTSHISREAAKNENENENEDENENENERADTTTTTTTTPMVTQLLAEVELGYGQAFDVQRPHSLAARLKRLEEMMGREAAEEMMGREAAEEMMGREAAEEMMGREAAEEMMGREAAEEMMGREAAEEMMGREAASG